MADLLYFNKDWEKCGPAFDAVVTDDPRSPLAAESAFTSVLCYQNLYSTGGKEKDNADQCAILWRTQRDLEWQKADRLFKAAEKGGPDSNRLFEAAGDAYMILWRKYGETSCEKKEARCKRMEDVLYNASRSFQAARLLAPIGNAIPSRREYLDFDPIVRRIAFRIGDPLFYSRGLVMGIRAQERLGHRPRPTKDRPAFRRFPPGPR